VHLAIVRVAALQLSNDAVVDEEPILSQAF